MNAVTVFCSKTLAMDDYLQNSLLFEKFLYDPHEIGKVLQSFLDVLTDFLVIHCPVAVHKLIPEPGHTFEVF